MNRDHSEKSMPDIGGLQGMGEGFHVLLDSTPLPVVITGSDGELRHWNPAARQVFGWKAGNMPGPLPQMVPPDKKDEAEDVRRMVLEGHSFRSVETRRMRSDGTDIDVLLSTAPLRGRAGEIIATIDIYEDITDRKKKENDLRFYAAIIQSLPEPVCAIDRHGNTTLWNASAERMLLYRAAEIIGKPISMVIPPEIAAMELEHCMTLLNTDGYFSGYETVRLARDGTYVPVEITAVAIKDRTGTIRGYASIMTDIRGRKRESEERMKVHTLESVGILAGGIAHDFNNLLCSIIGHIEVAKLSLDPADKAYARLTEAEGSCDKAQELSDRLITFATGGDPLRKMADLGTLIREAVAAVVRDAPVTVTHRSEPGLRPVAIDERQMAQVFRNLAMNSLEAMPRGGIIDIFMRNLHGADSREPMLAKERDYLEVVFRDTGSGIPPENIANVFDPYFSTKNTYSTKGLGLGLAVCFSIIKRHEGFITVESSPGEGTAFHLYLPAVA